MKVTKMERLGFILPLLLLVMTGAGEPIYGDNGIEGYKVNETQIVILEHHIFGNSTPVMGLGGNNTMTAASYSQLDEIWEVMERQIDDSGDPHSWVKKTLSETNGSYNGVKLGVVAMNDGSWGILILEFNDVPSPVNSVVMLVYDRDTCDCSEKKNPYGWRVFGEGFIDSHPNNVKMISYLGVPQ